jgi:hypothetical protein
MKIKEGFILRKMSGQTVVLPVAGDLDLNMMIKLNGTACFLWEHLQEETEEDALVASLMKEYNVDEETARTCVKAFVKQLEEHGFLD